MKKPRAPKPTNPATDAAVAAARAASKAAPVMTDTQKLELFQAAQRFDVANNNASPDAIGAVMVQVMHERIQDLKDAEARLNALGKTLGRAGYSLDARTGVYTKTP